MLYQTARLDIRRLAPSDAPFILELLGEPGWLEHIGDRGVRTLDDARAYLQTGPLASYAEHGHGLYLVALRATGEPVGICGLLRRNTLDAPDLGYAVLARHQRRGYATEAARATLDHARDLGMTTVLAITSPENRTSHNILETIGMRRVPGVTVGEGGLVSVVYRA